MSKLEQTSPDYDAYEAFIESERMELRREGAEEMRIEILRALEEYAPKFWQKQQRLGMDVAKIIVERASI